MTANILLWMTIVLVLALAITVAREVHKPALTSTSGAPSVLTGLNTKPMVSVEGGEWGYDKCFMVGPFWDQHCEYRRVWSSEPGSIPANAQIYIRVMSGAPGTTTTGTLTIDGVPESFSVKATP